MTVFEIRDSYLSDKIVGFLFYHKRKRRFSTELPNGLDEWDAPAMFMRAAREENYSIGFDLSMKFVRQRIVPAERQNIGMILKNAGLKYYDEYRLLCLSEGRCAQDELHLVKTELSELPPDISDRLNKKVRDVVPMEGYSLMVFYKDGLSQTVDVKEILESDHVFGNVLKGRSLFMSVSVSPGGNGIEWGEERVIPAEILRKTGKDLPISYDMLITFSKDRLANTSDAADALDCSRQYLNSLVKQGILHPVKGGSNNTVFLRSELETL